MRIQPSREFTLVDMARAFNVAAHTSIGQKRKYTNEDYHVHPEEVLQILLTYCDPSPVLQAASLLHDVIEDTNTTRDHIAQVFGQDVSSLVVQVSDVSKPSDGNRKVRKDLDLQHLAKASLNGKRLKCADLISNAKSICQYDPAFAKTFLVEMFDILVEFYLLIDDERVFRKAMTTCHEAFQKLYPDPVRYIKAIGKRLSDQPDHFVDIFHGKI